MGKNLNMKQNIITNNKYFLLPSKKFCVLWSLFFFSLLLLSSCKHTVKEDTVFNKDVYNPEYSTNFKIQGTETSEDVLISVKDPWQGANNISTELLITDNNQRREDSDKQILKGKAERIVCMSSTHIAMLDALNSADKIVGVSGKEYITNPFVRNNDNIRDIGYEGNIDYETLVSLQPDLILLFSVNGSSAMEPKLKELGIPFLYIGDYVEEDPLGKLEWIIPIAQVLGKEEMGVKIFKEISGRYNSLKEKVNKGVNSTQKPKVMVNAPFLDSWFMPSSESYVARMIKDAGGEYIYKKNTANSSQPIDMEEALKLVNETDFWINIGTFKTKKDILNNFPGFTNANCVRTGKLYNNNKITTPGGGNDCYESGVVNPDIILRDMVKIFHPELIDEEFIYYYLME